MIDLKSLDFDITDAIRAEVQGVETSIRKHLEESNRVAVTLSKIAPDVFRVHMKARYLGSDIISDHESHNFHKALDSCKDHFIKQVDKRRLKSQKGRRHD